MTGKFISIEGTEGAGKSTAIHFVRDYLLHAHLAVLWTREPGGTDIAEEIRKLILHSRSVEVIEPETELLMVFAARNQHLKNIIQPALQAGKWVVSDRFIDASYAYQGGGRKIDEKYIRLLDQWIVGPVYPDLTLLLDISPEEGFRRTDKRGTERDRIEQENINFFARVREAYLERAKQDPERIRMIDAGKPIGEVQEQLKQVMKEFVGK